MDLPTAKKICVGDFCFLGRSLSIEYDLALPSNQDEVKLSREVEKSQERERAARISQRVLSESEMTSLEESGKLIQLRIIGRIDPTEFQRVNEESISTARKEHRHSLAELFAAEGKGLISREIWNSYLQEISHNNKTSITKSNVNSPSKQIRDYKYRSEKGENKSNSYREKKSSKEICDTFMVQENMNNVCGVCAHVYKLLDCVRNLLDENVAADLSSTKKISLDSLESQNEIFTFLREKFENSTERSSVVKNNANNDTIPPKSIFSNLRSKTKQVTIKENEPYEAEINQEQEIEEKNGKYPIRKGKKITKNRIKTKALTKQNDKISKESNPETVFLVSNERTLSGKIQGILEDENMSVCILSRFEEFTRHMEKADCSAIIVVNSQSKINASEITKWVRGREKQLSTSTCQNIYVPILSATSDLSENHVQSLIRIGVDGCIKIPIDEQKLVKTVINAIKLKGSHQRQLKKVYLQTNNLKENQVTLPFISEKRKKKTISNSRNEKSMKTKQLEIEKNPKVKNVSLGGDDVNSGTGDLEFDKQTAFTYTIMDSACYYTKAKKDTNENTRPTQSSFFNLVVCHDIFDTHERFKIFFKPLIMRYPGLQILLWNYPGQAFTTFKDGQILNNEFHAKCLHKLIEFVGRSDKDLFNTKQPYYLLGFGNGASIATYFAATYRPQALRGLLLINGFSFVDPHYASVLHDCRNVFQCSPETRPDLPVYFYSRFIFSPAYLKKITAPLALNLYTAVHNPVSLRGRIQLCSGALDHIDVRSLLEKIASPIISIHGEHDSLVRLLHAKFFANGTSRFNCQNVHQTLKGGTNKTMTITVDGGHELFQEKKNWILTFIEQILTGYHETHNVPISLSNQRENSFVKEKQRKSKLMGHTVNQINQVTFEDNFINSFIRDDREVNAKKVQESILKKWPEKKKIDKSTIKHETWDEYRDILPDQLKLSQPKPNIDLALRKQQNYQKRKEEKAKLVASKVSLVTDPVRPSFERQENNTIYTNPRDYPEVKEYMTWRLRRNKKRLSRLENAAAIIQRTFRGLMAKTLVERLKYQSSALNIQKCFRGFQGRQVFDGKKKELWAALITQKAIRGHLGRLKYCQRCQLVDAQVLVSRQWRGFRHRKIVRNLISRRNIAAILFQTIWRRCKAKKTAFQERNRRNGCIVVQRLYRGYLGRKKAEKEREKYLFSCSRSNGIELGRQMLTEHKLHATKLQSEISILSKEKAALVNQVDETLEEISQFEVGVTILEKEMHQLSKVERENGSSLTSNTKHELKEQKTRLDQEFSQMITKISARRDLLQKLEEKLGSIERERQSKYEQLQSLERKLVILLEAQQNELNEIKRRQGKYQNDIIKGVDNTTGNTSSNGNSWKGPSDIEKQRAAQLMESTETMMKFGFMSMSMTYFSSLNMVKAMKTVAAQDTVMAAVSKQDNSPNTNDLLYHDKLLTSEMDGTNSNTSCSGNNLSISHLPDSRLSSITPSLDVEGWNVDDVTKWLSTLSLSQYNDRFNDGAVDGAFLCVLTDDDLRHTLGVEHKLHRKKILFNIDRLKNKKATDHIKSETYEVTNSVDQINHNIQENYNIHQITNTSSKRQSKNAFVVNFEPSPKKTLSLVKASIADIEPENPTVGDRNSVDIEELFSWVRHQKHDKLKEAIDHIPNKLFDETYLRVQYVEGYGTAYSEAYEHENFNLNKTDEHGNILLHIAAQNGNIRIGKLLLQKGSNPNHQNKVGQTPGHFAVAYHFYDFASWLFDVEDGAGANDELFNTHGLGPYDGLTQEDI